MGKFILWLCKMFTGCIFITVCASLILAFWAGIAMGIYDSRFHEKGIDPLSVLLATGIFLGFLAFVVGSMQWVNDA